MPESTTLSVATDRRSPRSPELGEGPDRRRAMRRALWVCSVVLASTVGLAYLVCVFEEWPFSHGLHVTVDALMNNGSGKYAVNHAASRLVLAMASLLGFFSFIEYLVDLLPSLAGWPALSEKKLPVGGGPQSRVRYVLLLWVLEMVIMSASYYFDHLATDEEGRLISRRDRLSSAILYAVSTGCSGGFGHLSSNWIGVAHIMVSVPTTAWLAREHAWSRLQQNSEKKGSTSDWGSD